MRGVQAADPLTIPQRPQEKKSQKIDSESPRTCPQRTKTSLILAATKVPIQYVKETRDLYGCTARARLSTPEVLQVVVNGDDYFWVSRRNLLIGSLRGSKIWSKGREAWDRSTLIHTEIWRAECLGFGGDPESPLQVRSWCHEAQKLRGRYSYSSCALVQATT